MKRVHIAIMVNALLPSIEEYSQRFGVGPVCIVENTWALWLTPLLNFSIEVKPDHHGQLKHLGFEDPEAASPHRETDINGLLWEQFTQEQQKDLIFKLWPNAQYSEAHVSQNESI